jgi:hypothetical protein
MPQTDVQINPGAEELPPPDRRVRQRPGHFLLATPDRLLIQPGDPGHQAHPAVPQPVRLDGGIPPPLGFPESALSSRFI